MKMSDLLISGVNITEDDYHYKGQFILDFGGKTMHIDVAEIDNNNCLLSIKEYFNIEEPIDEIRKNLMQRLVEKAGISSKIVEGENYFERKAQRK
jgi:hypothetical protein